MTKKPRALYPMQDERPAQEPPKIRPDRTFSVETMETAQLIDAAVSLASRASLYSQQSLATAYYHLMREAERQHEDHTRAFLHAAAELLTHYMQPGTETE